MYSFRRANLSDVKFITKAILEAEKGNSKKVGIANLSNLSEKEFSSLLVNILEEEIDGCEFSIRSFLIAEFKDEPVATFAGWVESRNEDELPSLTLKSNLLGFYLPKENLNILFNNSAALKELQLNRKPSLLQFEYAFVQPKHRGKNLIQQIIHKIIDREKQKFPEVSIAQVQLYANNYPAISAYSKMGFVEVDRRTTENEIIADLLPHNAKILMEKRLI